ncbi:hypothetical protein BKA61DRAFT_354715 [Leptodontidium sp. MPI-SDFR-AT-0119]|nr:hypothetical protein BKA61DRAFT_354715 [Leptodontidium sp. MPI-SDFR-AT-0119]
MSIWALLVLHAFFGNRKTPWWVEELCLHVITLVTALLKKISKRMRHWHLLIFSPTWLRTYLTLILVIWPPLRHTHAPFNMPNGKFTRRRSMVNCVCL